MLWTTLHICAVLFLHSDDTNFVLILLSVFYMQNFRAFCSGRRIPLIRECLRHFIRLTSLLVNNDQPASSSWLNNRLRTFISYLRQVNEHDWKTPNGRPPGMPRGLAWDFDLKFWVDEFWPYFHIMHNVADGFSKINNDDLIQSVMRSGSFQTILEQCVAWTQDSHVINICSSTGCA